ncbi:MAG: putative lipoprotein [bacterium]|nr:putative lipoprotein [bacterium]
MLPAHPLRGAAMVALLALVAATGCSISASSVSISESIGTSSESISGSSASSSRSDTDRYREDVAEYTKAYVQSGGQYDAFQRTLADLARKRGISDWESSKATWVGVGQGLARAKVSEVALDTWKTNLAGDDDAKRRAIESGYRHPGD